MPWFKVDDKFHSHPKVMELSLPAVGLWTLAGSWCADYLTDGEIRRGQLRRLGASEEAAAELVEAGLWEETEGGYRFCDWHDYQPTREATEGSREVSRRRWAMNNDPELRKAVRGRDGNNCRYCAKTVNWSDRRGPNGGTYDHVTPMSAGGGETAENIVVACRACNTSKGARTPDQSGMTLLEPRSDLGSSQVDSDETRSHTRPPEPEPVPVPVSPNGDTATPAPEGRGRKKPAAPIPDDWTPTDAHKARAEELGVDATLEAEKFFNHAKANDRRQADWSRSFYTWLANARTFQDRSSAGGQQFRSSAEKRVDAGRAWLSRTEGWDDARATADNPFELEHPDEPRRITG